MLSVMIRVNTHEVGYLQIRNCGPTSAEEAVNPEGERIYHWTDGENEGHLTHHRGHGWSVLVIQVLTARLKVLAEQEGRDGRIR